MEYEDCKKMAILALRSAKEQITDENIGIVVTNILIANHRYNKDIGNEFGFRKMYIQFAIKDIRKFRKRSEHVKFVEDYTPYLHKAVYKDQHSTIFWSDMKKLLTNIEYEIILSKYRDNKTLVHIGKDFNKSKEWVRQIIKTAHRKIKRGYV